MRKLLFLFIMNRFNQTEFRVVKTSHLQRKPKWDSQMYETLDRPRPNTTMMLNRTSLFTNYLTIDQAKLQLKQQFKKDMNCYINNKIIKLTSHNKQPFCNRKLLNQNPEIDSVTNSILHNNSPKNMKQMKISSLVSPSTSINTKQVIKQPYLINTKEKIHRILDRKKQEEERYKGLKQAINSKYSQQFKKRNRFKQFKPLAKLKEEEWSKHWEIDVDCQLKRYRRRVFEKHIKSRSLTIDWP